MPSLEVHYKLFGTDGVSLQSQELTAALQTRGWTALPCASDVPASADGLRLADLSYQSEDAKALRARLFPAAGAADPAGGAALIEDVLERAQPIRQEIESFVDAREITVLHVRNLMSLPYNLPATCAVYDVARSRPDIGFLFQHHDLYWEGPNARNFVSPYPEVRALLARVMCPALPNARHVLINPIAAEALAERTGIQGDVVPDGFDFSRAVPEIDDERFRNECRILTGDASGIGRDDIVVDMPARIAINKAIEVAIQFTRALGQERARLEQARDGVGSAQRQFGAENRVVLMLPQGEDVDDNRTYLDRLVAYARTVGVTVAYGGDVVVPDRSMLAGDTEHVPFYGTYRSADIVCYSPEHEGFGNQAIETVWARRPLAVLEYPVFRRFVAAHVPHRVSLGSSDDLGAIPGFDGLHAAPEERLTAAAAQAVDVLLDHDLERRWTEADFHALRAFCDIGTIAERYLGMYRELSA